MRSITTRFSLLVLLSGTALPACFQELNSQAAKATNEAKPRDPKAPPTTAIEDPSIGLDPNDETKTTTDPCVKTSQDAHTILGTYCGNCHDQGEASSGVPKFDFLMNDQSLMSSKWTVGAEVRNFIVPGDPENSWLYRRPLLGTMPPLQTDLRNTDYPRPTISDLSVLREWIAHCVGQPAGSSNPMPPPNMNDGGTPTADNARCNFEMDMQGWVTLPAATGQGAFANVAISTDQKFAGASSLAGTIAAAAPLAYYVELQNPPVVIPPAAKITFHVMLPADAPIGFLQPYVVDSNGALTGSYWMYPQTGTWTTLTVMVPATATTITRLGMEFHTSAAWNGTVYIDSINW